MPIISVFCLYIQLDCRKLFFILASCYFGMQKAVMKEETREQGRQELLFIMSPSSQYSQTLDFKLMDKWVEMFRHLFSLLRKPSVVFGAEHVLLGQIPPQQVCLLAWLLYFSFSFLLSLPPCIPSRVHFLKFCLSDYS